MWEAVEKASLLFEKFEKDEIKSLNGASKLWILEVSKVEDFVTTSHKLKFSLFEIVIILSTDVWPIPLLG